MSEKKHFKKMENAMSGVGRYIKGHPRPVLIIMLIIMFLGIVGLFIRRANSGQTPSQALDGIVLPIDTVMENGAFMDISELYEVMQLESETRRILKKDSLTHDDSLFLEKVNEKLNSLLNEKNRF